MRLHRVFFLYTLTSFQILEVEKFGLGICLYPKLKLQLYGISPPFPQMRKRVYWREKLAVYPNPKTKKGILTEKLAVYPNQKTRKGILTEKTRCIPKPKDEKGYTDRKTRYIPKLKYATGYSFKKVCSIPKIQLEQKKYICSMLSSDSIGDVGENICFLLRSII